MAVSRPQNLVPGPKSIQSLILPQVPEFPEVPTPVSIRAYNLAHQRWVREAQHILEQTLTTTKTEIS